MQSIDIVRQTRCERTPRVIQLEGLFDIPMTEVISKQWHFDCPLPEEWNIGLIVGPSGVGKSTILREMAPVVRNAASWTWPESSSILDGFPTDMSIKEIIAALCAVGFSSPPAWRKPYHILSTGEQFRVGIARTLLATTDGAIAGIDEFTGVVDRQVAKIAACAMAKAVRRRKAQVICASCHYDIVEWLAPDWIIEPHKGRVTRGRHRRPDIRIRLQREDWKSWEPFREHHYLSSTLHRGARCYVGYVQDCPAVFSAWLRFPHPDKRIKFIREHRTVVLPDFQGVGIGVGVSTYLASVWTGLGFRAISTTTHPAMIASRNRSRVWKMTSKPGLQWSCRSHSGKVNREAFNRTIATRRYTASFRYVGPAAPRTEIEQLGLC